MPEPFRSKMVIGGIDRFIVNTDPYSLDDCGCAFFGHRDLYDGAAIAASIGVEDRYKQESPQIVRGLPICIYSSEWLRDFAFQSKKTGMQELIELSAQDRETATRMWEELNGTATLKDCEDAVQVVKEC